MKTVLRHTVLFYIFFPLCLFGQDSTQNFVREVLYKSSSGNISNPNLKQSTITYLDGLGRPIQTIAVHGGGQGQDLVSHIVYDEVGRESKKYLHYAISGGKGLYQKNAPSDAATNLNDSNPYHLTVYEDSPLNRVVKQAGPGAAWDISSNPEAFDDHSVKIKYTTNSSNEVKQFEAFNSSGNKRANTWNIAGGLSFVGYYPANQLLVEEHLDENNTSQSGGNRVKEYKDKLGKLLLKRVYVSNDKQLDTYYVYDDVGQLRAVFPPLLSANLTTVNSLEFSGADLTNITELAFLYCYDTEGRMTFKKVPGAEYVSMTYNARNLLATSQDGNQRNLNVTSYTKYDSLNRVVETGVGTEWLTKTYYDGLNASGASDNAWVSNGQLVSGNAVDLNVKNGLVTAGSTRVINADGTYGGGLYNSVYYDSRGRVIRSFKEHYAVGSTPTETVYLTRSYIGTVLEEKIVQGNSLGNLTLTKTFQYDHADRLKSICHRIVELISNKSREEVPHLLNWLSYDQLGRLERKSLGLLPSTFLKDNPSLEFAETQYFKYNIRNWLTESNAYRLLDKASYTGKPSDDKQNFYLRLEYATQSQYNGNIEKYAWQGGAYNLSYDGANRLLKAGGGLGAYYEESLSYDDNGNIQSLNRLQNSGGTKTLVDSLSYSYSNSSKGNRLLGVTDKSNSLLGYANANTTGDDFAYDANGNLTLDKDKGIANISYNVLNLVRQVNGVTSGTSKAKGVVQNYVWDATGAKLSYISTGTGTVKKTYVGGVEYTTNENGDLVPNRIFTDEGHVMKREGWTENSSKSKYVYYYTVKDHLGNIRIVIDDEQEAQVWQNNSYSAFGLLVAGTVAGVSTESSAKANDRYYNGKEAQDVVGWYDFGARMYNPEIGRWMNIDPLSETSRRWSPYNYTYNNPLRFIDPDGMANADADRQKGDRHLENDTGHEKIETNQCLCESAGDPPTAKNVNTSSDYDKLKPGTNVVSGNYAGTKLDEVVVKGKRQNVFAYAITNFASPEYNRRFYPRNPNDHNDYGPLRLFTLYGFQVQYNLPFGFYGGFGYVSFKGNGSFYTVYNPLQIAGSPSLIAGASPQLASMKEGLSFNLFVGNPLTPETTLQDFGGWSGALSAQYGFGVGYSRSISFNPYTGKFERSKNGYQTFNLTFGAEAGGGAEISRTTLLNEE